MFVAVPMLVGFLIFGREFITLWMGPQYVQSSQILFILTLPTFGAVANYTCGSAVLALGYVKRWACMAAVEALLNLFLSIVFVLVMGWGIYGVALGTLVPMFLVNNLWLFMYTCKILKADLRRFSQETVLRLAEDSVAEI